MTTAPVSAVPDTDSRPAAPSAPSARRGRGRRGAAPAQAGAAPAPARSQHPLLAQLAQWHPALFGQPPLPLKRGIFEDLLAAHAELDKAQLKYLLAELGNRNVRIMGIEGARPSLFEPGMPPALQGGRAASDFEVAVEEPKAATAPAHPEPAAVMP